MEETVQDFKHAVFFSSDNNNRIAKCIKSIIIIYHMVSIDSKIAFEIERLLFFFHVIFDNKLDKKTGFSFQDVSQLSTI